MCDDMVQIKHFGGKLQDLVEIFETLYQYGLRAILGGEHSRAHIQVHVHVSCTIVNYIIFDDYYFERDGKIIFFKNLTKDFLHPTTVIHVLSNLYNFNQIFMIFKFL